jgi:hypothetical protein
LIFISLFLRSYAAQFPPHAHAMLHDYVGGVLHAMPGLIEFKRLTKKHFPGLVPEQHWSSFPYQWFILSQKGLWRSWLTEFPSSCVGDHTSGSTHVDPTACAAKCTDRFPREVSDNHHHHLHLILHHNVHHHVFFFFIL